MVAANVVNRYNVLIAHGHRLQEEDVLSLRKRFPDVTVQVIDPLLDDLADFDNISHDQEVSLEIRRSVADAATKVSNHIRNGVALTSDNVRGMQKTVREMVDYMLKNPVAVAVIEQTKNWQDDLQQHCSTVFYLSLVMGNTILNYIKKERERLSAVKKIPHSMNLSPLGTAALVHDIGMVPLESLCKKTEPLTPEELQKIRMHPKMGAEMLPADIDPMVRLIVRCHHENYDGSGYPQGLTGLRTNIFARIVRVADAYTAGLSTRSYRAAKSPLRVLWEMTHGSYRNCYDPMIIGVLKSISQPFPVSTKVTLQDGRIGVVTKHNSHNAFNPQILVAYNAQEEPLPDACVDGPFYLEDRPDIRLVKLGQEDISYLYEGMTDIKIAFSENVMPQDVLDLVYP